MYRYLYGRNEIFQFQSSTRGSSDFLKAIYSRFQGAAVQGRRSSIIRNQKAAINKTTEIQTKETFRSYIIIQMPTQRGTREEKERFGFSSNAGTVSYSLPREKCSYASLNCFHLIGSYKNCNLMFSCNTYSYTLALTLYSASFLRDLKVWISPSI